METEINRRLFDKWNSFETKQLHTMKRFVPSQRDESFPPETAGLSEKQQKIARLIQERNQKITDELA